MISPATSTATPPPPLSRPPAGEGRAAALADGQCPSGAACPGAVQALADLCRAVLAGRACDVPVPGQHSLCSFPHAPSAQAPAAKLSGLQMRSPPGKHPLVQQSASLSLSLLGCCAACEEFTETGWRTLCCEAWHGFLPCLVQPALWWTSAGTAKRLFTAGISATSVTRSTSGITYMLWTHEVLVVSGGCPTRRPHFCVGQTFCWVCNETLLAT